MQDGGDRPALDFWFDFGSTYAYLSAMRIAALANNAGVAVRYRPFLLGPIFAGQGWSTSPFNVYPAKGRYMVRDMHRIAASRGLAFALPEPFPANGLHAARIGLLADDEGWAQPWSEAVFRAEFAEGLDIAVDDVLRLLLRAVGRPENDLERSRQPANKQHLRTQSERAVELDIFGAPTFLTPDGELFWGDDRLEAAIAWCRRAD